MADTLLEGPTDGQPEAGIYTETLARLYLRQGIPERALGIYRHLAQEHPENQQLQVQLRTLEAQLQQGSLERDSGTESVASPVEAQPPAHPPSRATHAVIAQLERWLHYLQRQQPHH